jgi:hypothetical protein
VVRLGPRPRRGDGDLEPLLTAEAIRGVERVQQRCEAGRKAHLEGRIAQALMGKADELLASPPDLRMADVLAVK